MSLKYWILVGQTPIEVDQHEWSLWFERGDRQVSLSPIKARGVTYRISTVFLGIDHGYGFAQDVPLLFETMVFIDDGSDEDPWADYQVRSRSYIEAKKVHDMLVVQVISNPTP